MAAGHPVYLAYTPQSNFPSANGNVSWESYEQRTSVSYSSPSVILQKPDNGPFAPNGYDISGGPTIAYRIFYPQANTILYAAPWQPVRYDVYNQILSKAKNSTVSGTAPTQAIYTGVHSDGCS